MSRPVRCFGLLVSLVLLGQAQAQQVGDTYDRGAQVRIGQYSTQSALPDPSVSDPLAVFVRLSYPRQGVATVGDAVRYTLMRTGWSLHVEQLQADASAFLQLPLPESQRTIGTFRVRDVLQALVGATWQWTEEPVARRLWISLAESGEASAPVTAWTPLEVGHQDKRATQEQELQP